jgi:predicted transposase YbfD/YdcC
MQSPLPFFSGIRDPRVDRTKEHLLEDIIFIAISSVICGAETWNDMADFGKSKQEWLKAFLKLPNGIPSHDTFNRVFSAIEPSEFERCFLDWTRSIANLTEGEVVSIDGKTLRRSRDKGNKSVVHMVSAWACANNIVLGQRKVDAKSNEITAIPALLELLVLKGCIVTIDAMGCQKEIASAIVAKDANYVLALKGNQGGLLQQVEESFRFISGSSTSEETDFGHGRIEKRTCSVIDDLSMVEQKDLWVNLHSLVRIESERFLKSTGETEREIRYYITSLGADPQLLNRSIRCHWGIENSLHWVLDVGFNEDQSRNRAGFAAQNFSVINRIALNLLKNEVTTKRGIKGKRLKAGWDNNYLMMVLKN